MKTGPKSQQNPTLRLSTVEPLLDFKETIDNYLEVLKNVQNE